jgi:hypothetical protein
MTTLIVKSDSKKKTCLLIELAEEPGLSASANDFKELDINAMVKGIGRKATNEELIAYLSKKGDVEPIDLEIAFSKYS